MSTVEAPILIHVHTPDGWYSCANPRVVTKLDKSDAWVDVFHLVWNDDGQASKQLRSMRNRIDKVRWVTSTDDADEVMHTEIQCEVAAVAHEDTRGSVLTVRRRHEQSKRTVYVPATQKFPSNALTHPLRSKRDRLAAVRRGPSDKAFVPPLFRGKQ